MFYLGQRHTVIFKVRVHHMNQIDYKIHKIMRTIPSKTLEYELFRVFYCQGLTSISVWILLSEAVCDAS